MSWKTLHASVKGLKSICQDTYKIGYFDDFLLVVVCDGAGSATFAEKGAKIVCATVFDTLMSLATIPDEKQIRELLTKVKDRLATEEGSIYDYATTLLCGVVGSKRAFYFQIGDGLIVQWSGSEGCVVFTPRVHEYVNETCFVTDDTLDLRIYYTKNPPLEIAFLTDGLESLATNQNSHSVFENFFQPFRESLLLDVETDLINPIVEKFLDSESVMARTNDDKTLIVARYEGY